MNKDAYLKFDFDPINVQDFILEKTARNYKWQI